jgi:hypothetical protein
MAAPKRRKKRKKKSSEWSPAAVAGRIMWGPGGFKRVLRQARREWISPRDVTPARPKPDAGKLKAAGVRQRKDGTWAVKPSQAPKRKSVKRRVEELQTRIAVESDRHAEHVKAQAGQRPTPMSKRALRKPDGTLNGSRPDPAKAQRDQDKQWLQTQREVRRISRNADATGRYAEELLGWRKPRRQS